MALSQSTAIAQIRDLVAAVTGLNHVYAPSETDDNRLPAALNEFPCAMVLPGPTLEYILTSGMHRHTYEVAIRIYESVMGDIGEAANTVLPMVDRVIEKFAGNIGLAESDGSAPRANYCLFLRSSGFATQEYSEINYIGYEITLKVSETASATVALGS